MLSAIVYESNSGYTKKYAEILSRETGIPVYSRENAKSLIAENSEIIYMGWLMAGSIKGYKAASPLYKIKAVCAVGMAVPSEKYVDEILQRHKIKNTEIFYLQGGFNFNKLHGIYKLMMRMMAKIIGSSVEKKAEKTEEEIIMLKLINDGGDFVTKENLNPVIEWYQKLIRK